MRSFVVLGLANGGLFMARQLKKQWASCLIFGVGDPSTDIGRYSNTLTSFFPVLNAQDTYKTLEYLCQMYADIEAYICSNIMLEWMASGPEELVNRIRLQNRIEIYRIFADKKKTADFLTALKVSVPTDSFLSDDNMGGLVYPIVVKPSEKNTTMGLSKCTYIDSPQILKSFIENVDSNGICHDSLVFQQYIMGDNRWEYGYGGYFMNGQPLVDVCFYQLRQVPQGICCYIREISDDQLSMKIRDVVTPILESTQFNGIIEFDIKQDEKSKKLFVLDVNPRPWKSSDMLTVKLGDSTMFEPKIRQRKVIWRQPYLELKSLLHKNKNNVPYTECYKISNYGKFQTHITLFDPRDIAPFINNILEDVLDFLKYFRRHIHL